MKALLRIVVVAALFGIAHLVAPRPVEGFAATEWCNGRIEPSCLQLRLCHHYERCGPDEYCCSRESTTYYYRNHARM